MTEAYKNESIIELKEVSAGYNDKIVLANVTFSVSRGEFVYLIGKTGAGKSSILKMLYADLLPLKGIVRVGKYEVQNIKNKEIPYLRRKIGIVFQDFQLLPDRNIAENITFVMKATGWRDSSKMKGRLADLLMMVGLSGKASAMPHQLSGGEQQRVVIARALVNDPLVLLADEPTGNLDPEVSRHIMDLLIKIHRGGTAVLMATHEHGLIREYPARTLECIGHNIIDHPAGNYAYSKDPRNRNTAESFRIDPS